jgi:hypothetical protein
MESRRRKNLRAQDLLLLLFAHVLQEILDCGQRRLDGS